MSLQSKLTEGIKDLRPLPRGKRRPELLLCANIPKPLHRVNPRTILGKKWWDETRQKAAEETNQHCLACGVHKGRAKGKQWLEGHEIYEIDYVQGRSTYIETVPLCHYCHNFIHDGRLQALLDKGEITHNFYAAVLQHGERVMEEVGLSFAQPYEGPFAPWGDWRLVIDGEEYPPKFKNARAWLKEFR